MQENNKNTNSKVSDEAILEQARRSGLSYNETIEWLAKTTGGRGTHIYSNTNVEEVKRQNKMSEDAKNGKNK